MQGIILIIALIFCVLNIILFFKVWEMTSDVSDIRNFIINKEHKTLKENITPKKSANGKETEGSNVKKRLDWDVLIVFIIVVVSVVIWATTN